MKFSKRPTTFEQQIDILISRGMKIQDRELAQHYLAHLNYYRIGAYWLPFEANHSTHIFKDGVAFENVLDLYVFDRELRLLVMDAIERFEVSIRTRWAYHLAHTYGPHAYLNDSIFFDDGKYKRCLDALEEELSRSTETFVSHYKNKYTEPPSPPVWAVVEVMSLGQLSKWYSNLKRRRDRKVIATTYELDEIILVSFLHHLTIVRNFCAHHSRLWNRRFAFQVKLPKYPEQLLRSINSAQPKYLYNTLVFLKHVMNFISPGHHWENRFLCLLEQHPMVTLESMGFPEKWRELDVWVK